jgi:pantothenate kinase
MLQQGLSTSTLASSFGKVITSKKKLTDYRPEDLASTLLSAFTYNIAQVSFCSIFTYNIAQVSFCSIFLLAIKSLQIMLEVDNVRQRSLVKFSWFLPQLCASMVQPH